MWATCANEKVRNGQRAVESAKRACELTDWTAWNTLDTLAAAHAEAGDFDNAVKYAKQALSLAPADKKREIQERLDGYLDEKPWREE
jgi:Flp pilus assembly protein TadD